MTPRAIVALADEPPPDSIHHGTLGLLVAFAIAGAAIAVGLWLAKRRGGNR